MLEQNDAEDLGATEVVSCDTSLELFASFAMFFYRFLILVAFWKCGGQAELQRETRFFFTFLKVIFLKQYVRALWYKSFQVGPYRLAQLFQNQVLQRTHK